MYVCMYLYCKENKDNDLTTNNKYHHLVWAMQLQSTKAYFRLCADGFCLYYNLKRVGE